MIAEWFFWLTGEIGKGFNNATLMREHTHSEDVSMGVCIIWLLFIIVLLMAIVLAISCALENKGKRNDLR